MTVNKERVELWIQALESDKYQQCDQYLRIRLYTDMPMLHCAEGVAMAVAEAHGVQIHPYHWELPSMPDHVQRWYGFGRLPVVEGETGVMSVIKANDRLGLSFWDIAQLLRAQYLKDES